MYKATEIIGVCIILFAVWLTFEMWRAPLMKENEDGSWTELKPARKLKDLFKRK
jgi:hypothetical protein